MSGFDKTLKPRARVRLSDSVLPPPRRHDSLLPGPPPRGTRTPAFEQRVPDAAELPVDAPGWMKRARRLSVALERAISGGEVEPAQLMALERAFAAYEMGGVPDETIELVAHLCERAYAAIRERFRDGAQKAYEDCAHVLYSGLPRTIRRNLDAADVAPIVREMRSNSDAWAAVVDATAKILGWDGRARAHAAQAIRAAIDASQERQSKSRP